MRKSTKVILIALAVLIGPAIYAGYLLYRESKVVDVLTVKVMEGMERRGVPMHAVSIEPVEAEKNGNYSFATTTDEDGVAYFYNLKPGWYQVDYLSDCEDEYFRVNVQGVKVYLQVYVDSCVKHALFW